MVLCGVALRQLLAQIPVDQMIDLPQQLPEAQHQRPHFVLLGQQAVVEFGQKVVVLCFPDNFCLPLTMRFYFTF